MRGMTRVSRLRGLSQGNTAEGDSKLPEVTQNRREFLSLL